MVVIEGTATNINLLALVAAHVVADLASGAISTLIAHTVVVE